MTVNILTSSNLSKVAYIEKELINIERGAILTMDSTPSVKPGTIQAHMSGTFQILNNSTTNPIVLTLKSQDSDLIFIGESKFVISGSMMTLGTGNGSSQSWNFGSLYSGLIPEITYVDVETNPGSNVYEPWPIFSIDPLFFQEYNVYCSTTRKTRFGNLAEINKVFFWHHTNRTLETGDGVNGIPVPNNCKIRIPNVYVTNDVALDSATSFTVDAYNGFAPTPTGGTFTITAINRATSTVLGTTADLAYNSTAAQIDAALESIPSLGAGTITSTGGPLPGTAVSLTLAGAYASTPLTLSATLGSTYGILNNYSSSYLWIREANTANMSKINLSQASGGILQLNNVSFSNKIIWNFYNFKKLIATNVGIGGDGLYLYRSFCDFQFNNVISTQSPFVYRSAGTGGYSLISQLYGNVSINNFISVSPLAAYYPPITFENCDFTLLNNIKIFNSTYPHSFSGVWNGVTFASTPEISINKLLTIGNPACFTLNNKVTLNQYSCSLGYGPKLYSYLGSENLPVGMGLLGVSSVQEFTVTNMSSSVFPSAYGPFMTLLTGRGSPYSRVAAFSTWNKFKIANLSLDYKTSGITTLFYPYGKLEMTNVYLNNRNSVAGPAFAFDQNTNVALTTRKTTLKKVFIDRAATNGDIGNYMLNDAQFDLVTLNSGSSYYAPVSTIYFPLLINGSVTTFRNYVGGNFVNEWVSSSSGTGHVTFGPFFSGSSLITSTTSSVQAAGWLVLPKDKDTAIAEIPFGMHGITSFYGDIQTRALLSGALSRAVMLYAPGNPTGGTFSVSVYGANNNLIGTTSNINYNATAVTIGSAIGVVVGVGSTNQGNFLSSSYLYTSTSTFNRKYRINPENLTGGSEPGKAYCYGYTNLQSVYDNLSGSNLKIEFQVKKYSDPWPDVWLIATGSNLTNCVQNIPNYDPNGDGLGMRLRFTAIGDDPYRAIERIVFPTNVSPQNWIIGDSSFNFQGPAATDKIRVERVSDGVQLYGFTGSGLKEFDIGGNIGESVYFRLLSSNDKTIMSTRPNTTKLVYGDNGTINLFRGSQIQTSYSSTTNSINTTLLNNLDATVSSRMSAVSGSNLLTKGQFLALK